MTRSNLFQAIVGAVLVSGSAQAAEGVITFNNANGAYSCFTESGFRVCPFWVEYGYQTEGHFHIYYGYESHHWNGNNTRQGLSITALDGSRFGLCSVDTRLTYAANNPDLEVGTSLPPLYPGDVLPGFSRFPVNSWWQKTNISGYEDVSTVYITSQSSHDWDNITLCDSCVFKASAPATIGAASGYNVFVFGNYTGGHDISGRVAAQGNVALDDFRVGASAGGNVLVSGGSLALSAGSVYGDVWYGGTPTFEPGTVNFAGTVRQGTPIDFNAARTELTKLSSNLAAQPANGTSTLYYGGALKLEGSDTELNVFSVTADQFAQATNITVSAPSTSTVVVNVSGSSVAFDGVQMYENNVAPARILYNFPQASTVNASSLYFHGSILAPVADVSFTGGGLAGTLVARSLQGDVTLTHAPFTGRFAKCTRPAPGPSCKVSYAITSKWAADQGGTNFQAEVGITWTGPSTTSWQNAWTFRGDEKITDIWSATVNQNGADVVTGNAEWNGSLVSGTTTRYTFIGHTAGTPSVPPSFRVNGVTCTP